MTTATEVRADPPVAPPRARGLLALRVIGWLLVAAGAVVGLYVVYALWLSDLGTEREQAGLLEDWQSTHGPIDLGPSPEPDPSVELDVAPEAFTPEREGVAPGEEGDDDPSVPLDVGDAMAVLGFHRPGEAERPVNADPLAVVEGVGVAELQRGPGHYPGGALPGADGNFAVAGHRVTYGRPFHDLDEIREGDEVHVWGRDGQRHVYEVVRTEVVRPSDSWVLGDDPLGTGRPTITLTTCHPRFSNRERLVMFGELVE